MTTKQTPKLVTTTLRIPEDLHARAVKAAEETGRPLNNFVLYSLRKYIERAEWLDDVRSEDDGK